MTSTKHFSTCAAPGLSPATVMVLPHSEISGRTASMSAAAPETMKDLADTPEKAALAIVASVLLNLDESLTR